MHRDRWDTNPGEHEVGLSLEAVSAVGSRGEATGPGAGLAAGSRSSVPLPRLSMVVGSRGIKSTWALSAGHCTGACARVLSEPQSAP